MNIRTLLAFIALFSLIAFVVPSCTPGSYLVNDECTLCPIGKFCDGVVATNCVAGTFADETGLDACKTCAAGSFTSESVVGEGFDVCEICPLGKSCNGTAATNCAADGYSDETGLDKCKTCATNSYTYEQVVGQGNTNCTICPVGSECDGDVMTPCPSGKYNADEGSTCKICTNNEYTSTTGNTECAVCTDGYYTAESQEGEGNSICAICPAGKACNGEIATPCTGNNYTDVEGKSTCDSCNAGSFVTPNSLVGGNVKCSICPVGSRCPNGINRHLCEMTNFQTSTGALTCDACPIGNYVVSASAGGNGQCLICPEGWVCSNGIDRTPCGHGQWTEGKGTNTTLGCAVEYCPTDYTCVSGSLVAPSKEWSGGHIAITVIAIVILTVAVIALGAAGGLLLVCFKPYSTPASAAV